MQLRLIEKRHEVSKRVRAEKGLGGGGGRDSRSAGRVLVGDGDEAVTDGCGAIVTEVGPVQSAAAVGGDPVGGDGGHRLSFGVPLPSPA